MDTYIQFAQIVVLEITICFFNHLDIVCAFFVEPEYGWNSGLPGSGDREFDPIPDREIRGLAHAPDIPLRDGMYQQYLIFFVNDPDSPACRNLEGLVVRAVFLGFLRHQADVGDVTHRRNIERAKFLAEADSLLIDTCVATIGDHRLGVVQLAIRAPHFSR